MGRLSLRVADRSCSIFVKVQSCDVKIMPTSSVGERNSMCVFHQGAMRTMKILKTCDEDVLCHIMILKSSLRVWKNSSQIRKLYPIPPESLDRPMADKTVARTLVVVH